ncbi:MAG: stage V sporulation protein AC [Clostridia bacterium]|nr:stage V sporulation protein AC [Clostridia bacterium]
MQITKKQYAKMVKQVSPPSKKARDFVAAFFVGGLICTFGQFLSNMYIKTAMTLDESKMAVSVTLILITAVLTGIGIFDKIAKFAGAGTLVPITGFANAMTSAAIEFKSEGWVLGLGAKIFTVAGPVIVYGTIASVVYGVIYWICQMI